MKKISVITMHRIYNYGSVLQTYATQKILQDYCDECEIIDYISPCRTKIPLFLDCPPNIKGTRLKKIFYYAAKIPSFVLKDITFGSFIRKYLNLSPKKYITNDDLLKNPPKADLYVSGSDQVWNSKYNQGVDKSYYLNFADKNAKKIAFVSSFGKSELNLSEQEKVKPMLSEYSAISVREDLAVKILKDMGIQGTCLIDPTLQIKKEEWKKLASKRLVKQKYLLLFLLYNEDNGATEYAKKFADAMNLKIVKLSWELKKPSGIDKLFTHRKPQDFISLFANADFVVTNSFHGVAFSINLNRQFVFIPRSEFNGRIESLLRLVGLESRKICDLESITAVYEKIDYNRVNDKLESERERAKKWLVSTMKELNYE